MREENPLGLRLTRKPEERGRVSGPVNSAYIESIHGKRIINKTVCINK